MRLTSYRNLLWITALLTGFCVAAPAQPWSARSATLHTTSPPIQQLSNITSGGNGAQTPADVGQQSSAPNLQPKNTQAGQTGDRVETASMIPDSASLLPVAAVIGFSFLLGGIVCGTIKKRP